MSESTHTAGPLEPIGNFVRTATAIGGYMIAECRDDHGNPHSYEAKANAVLFAAAPDLLKALTDLRQQVNDFCIQYGEADFFTGDATKAIAKATAA